MFLDERKNISMLQGAYRKLKSYYYYNKNFMVMRNKIVEFENDHIAMSKKFEDLAYALCHPKTVKAKNYIVSLIDAVDFYAIPKKFESDSITNNSLISNVIPNNKKMKSVNFFINAPIELHILDALWTVFLGKMDNDKKVLSYNVYGNTINKTALYDNNDNIDFESRVLFNRYFDNYTRWRNKAFETLEDMYRFKEDTVLISLDIKSYFYSVSFSFKKLSEFFDDHELLNKIGTLTTIVEKIYSKYCEKIISFRRDMEHITKNHYVLPIGLFSSMVLGNVYLKKFDENIRNLSGVVYYGRYVDDLLMVVTKTLNKKDTHNVILDELFVKTGIFHKEANNYEFVGYKGLSVQSDKIKLLYIDHKESRAIIDIYNDTIKIIPSQMDPLPDGNLNLFNFDEVAYSVQNFTKEKKIRDIGIVGVDAFKVGRFFSMLPRRYSQIDINSIKKEIDSHIKQIDKFFVGSQCIEFYSNWLNYMYFLAITEQHKRLHTFVNNTKKLINELKATSLDRTMYRKTKSINKKAKDYLSNHLETCLNVALCLNMSMVIKSFKSRIASVRRYIASNMFEHSLVTFPLANYLDYGNRDVSFCKMSLNDIGEYPKKIEDAFQFVWSPRFIHYDELLLLLFYHYHNQNKEQKEYQYIKDSLVDKFVKINHIKGIPFAVDTKEREFEYNYLSRTIVIPTDRTSPPEINVAIGSINISEEKCVCSCKNRWANVTLEEKEIFFKILRESCDFIKKKEDKDRFFKKNKTMFLVLPELCYPVYWLSDLIRFAKRTNIGIITGLQYLKDDKNRVYNYIATILPFVTGKKNYHNTFLYIREKNDYSPIEFENLAKLGLTCKNRSLAEYPIFNWKGIRISPMLCYEFTDIVARAHLKGRCDFVAAPVFNPDTTYFSNIIDSTARDLHAFVVQANTSFYGDSRVTGPYDRDSKDIFKIKGGDNDHVVIGEIDFLKYKRFQLEYSDDLNKKLKIIEKERTKKKPNYPKKDRNKPNLKPLSARFQIKD